MQTLRWRRLDSNHRSRVTRPSFSTPAHVTCLTPCTRKSRREREPILCGCRPPPAEPMVRILFPPAESQQTFGSTRTSADRADHLSDVFASSEPEATGVPARKWDRQFESGLLQRRVCKPSVPQRRSPSLRTAQMPPRRKRPVSDRATPQPRRFLAVTPNHSLTRTMGSAGIWPSSHATANNAFKCFMCCFAEVNDISTSLASLTSESR